MDINTWVVDPNVARIVRIPRLRWHDLRPIQDTKKPFIVEAGKFSWFTWPS